MIRLPCTGRDVKRRNINADSMRLSVESHTSITWSPLVSNHLDTPIDRLILPLHILISPFLQMNEDVCARRGGLLQNNYPLAYYLSAIVIAPHPCWQRPTTRLTASASPSAGGNGELGAEKLSVTWGKGAEEEGRLQRESGREDTSYTDLWFITGQGAQGRQWTDIEGLKGARGSDTAGGERKMISLIKLYEVIALHATRVPSSTIGAINCVCECGCDFLSIRICVSLFLTHTYSHTPRWTLLDFWYQHFKLSSSGLKPSSAPLYWIITTSFFFFFFFFSS